MTFVRLTRLSTIPLEGEPPKEFRIFAAGINDSTKGPALFDSDAAESVMAEYRRGGVELMLDLEHDSLSEAARAARSDSADALAWYVLELRNGELWASNVRWTPPGLARYQQQTQRYASPAFLQDEKTGRITALVNVALVSLPATYHATELVAASRLETRSMDPARVKAAFDALKAGDGEAALQILQDLLVAEVTGEESSVPVEPAADALAANSADAAVPATVELSSVLADVKLVRRQLSEIYAERAALDLEARRELVGELVKIGVELPCTAWQGRPEDRRPVQRLMAEPLAELRTRLDALRTIRATPVRPPVAVTLSATEQAATATMTPAQKARFEALRTLRRTA